MTKVILILSYMILANSLCQPIKLKSDFINISEHQEVATAILVEVDLSPAETVRLILRDKSCAECHRSSLATAVPAALKFYDLDEIDWYLKLGEKGIAGFETRIPNNEAFSSKQKDSILNFVKSLRKD